MTEDDAIAEMVRQELWRQYFIREVLKLADKHKIDVKKMIHLGVDYRRKTAYDPSEGSNKATYILGWTAGINQVSQMFNKGYVWERIKELEDMQKEKKWKKEKY